MKISAKIKPVPFCLDGGASAGKKIFQQRPFSKESHFLDASQKHNTRVRTCLQSRFIDVDMRPSRIKAHDDTFRENVTSTKLKVMKHLNK